MFAGNDLLALRYFKLDLRRNLVEATAAGIPLDGDQSEPIAVVVTYTVIGFKQAFVNHSFGSA